MFKYFDYISTPPKLQTFGDSYDDFDIKPDRSIGGSYIINQKNKETYLEYSNNPETKDCFDGISLPEVSFDDLGISFNDTGIDFSITFGLDGSCMAVDGTTLSFKVDEIKTYINK